MATHMSTDAPGTGGLPRMSGLVGALLRASAAGLAARDGATADGGSAGLASRLRGLRHLLRLPTAYTRFLASRLRPGAALLLVRDSGTWASGHSAQAINPQFAESLRLWTAGREHPLYRVTFSRPEVFSAAVADLYRRWL